MRINVDLGPSSSPAELEALVRAVRVSADVGTTAMLSALRRTASERMKYPTDSELSAASERLPQESESSLSYRATDFARTRRNLRENLHDSPPDYFWRRVPGRLDAKQGGVSRTNYERIVDGSITPWWLAIDVGLDVLDPELYAALVGDFVALGAPSAIAVRELTYRNPFGEELAAIGTGVEALSKTAGVIETAATLGSRRKIKRAEAKVAEETVEDRIAMSRTDRELREEQLRRSRLENEMAEQQLIALRIQNAQAIRALSAQAQQQAVAQHFAASGHLDEADAVQALDPRDAAALTEFSVRQPDIKRSSEPDPDE